MQQHVFKRWSETEFEFQFHHLWTSLGAQTIKTLPAVQETQVPSLHREDPLEKEVTTHSIFLPGEICGFSSMEEPGGLRSMWSQRVGHDFHFSTICLSSEAI